MIDHFQIGGKSITPDRQHVTDFLYNHDILWIFCVLTDRTILSTEEAERTSCLKNHLRPKVLGNEEISGPPVGQLLWNDFTSFYQHMIVFGFAIHSYGSQKQWEIFQTTANKLF